MPISTPSTGSSVSFHQLCIWELPTHIWTIDTEYICIVSTDTSLDSVDWSGYGKARYWPSSEVVWMLNPYKESCQRGDVMPVACWVSCGEGQALEGRLDGGTVWPEKQPSAGERCVFSHTLSPLANTVQEGFSRTGLNGEKATTGRDAEVAKNDQNVTNVHVMFLQRLCGTSEDGATSQFQCTGRLIQVKRKHRYCPALANT